MTIRYALNDRKFIHLLKFWRIFIKMIWWSLLSVLCIDYSSFWYLESCLALSKTRRIEYFAYSLLSFAFSEVESGGAGVSENMSSYGLFGVSVSHSVARVSHYLIGHENSHVELLCQLHQLTQDLAKHLLSLRKFSSSSEIIPENCHNWIDDEQRMGTFHHHSGCKIKQTNQMLYRVASSISDVFQSLLRIQLVPFCYFWNPFWPKSALSVNVDNFSVTTSFFFRKLGSHTQSMGKLSFSCSELSEHFS